MQTNYKVSGLSIITLLILTTVAVVFENYSNSDSGSVEINNAMANSAPLATGPAIKKSDPSAIKFSHFRVGNRNVKDILLDGDIAWVGTSGGVVKYDTAHDKHDLYDIKSGLLSNGVFHLSKLGQKIVVGTYGGGLSLLNPETEQWETFSIPDGLGDAFIYDVLETSGGDIWIATWSGANRIRGGVLQDRNKWDLFTVKNTAGGLPNDWVYGLAEGKNGEIWMATEGGLARFKDNTWKNWTHADGLGEKYEKVKDNIDFNNDPAKVSDHHARQKVEQGLRNINVAYNPNYIVALSVDKEGVVWCGTWGGGLARFDGEQWKNYTVADGLPGNHVFMIHSDSDNRKWVGTNNGLAKLESDKFFTYTTQDGLFSNTIFTMDVDANGTFWLGSYGGVTRIKGL